MKKNVFHSDINVCYYKFIMYNLLSDERIVIVKRLININMYDVYVFTIDTNKLKKSDFKDQNTREVYFIKRSIFHDDNIKSVRSKILDTFGVKHDRDIYLYTSISVDEEDKLYVIRNFLDAVFGNKQLVSTKNVNTYFKEHFNVHNDSDRFPLNYKDDDDVISYDSCLMKLKKQPIDSHNKVLSFSLLNTKQQPIMFISNPYKALLNEDNVLYKQNISYDFQDLNDLVTMNLPKEISMFVVVKEDLEKYGMQHFNTTRDYILDLYFPSEIQTIKTNIINKIDSIKNQINDFDFNSIVDTVHSNVILCKLVVNGIKSLNLSRMFNTFQVNENVPFTSYKTRNREYHYRLLKHNLHNLVDRSTFNKWIEIERKSITSRKDDVFTIKLRYKDTKTYINLSVKESGQYYVRFYFGSLKVSYEELEKYIQVMNGTILSELGLEPILLDINSKIEELKLNTMVTTKVSLLKEKDVQNNMSNNPFFSKIKDENNEYMLRYKRVSNYSKMDNISSYISSMLHLPYEELIVSIMSEFNLDEESAKAEYENKKDNIKLKQISTNGNITYVSKYNEGVMLLLKIINQNQMQVIFTKIENHFYHNNIIRSLILLTSTDHKVPLIINKSVIKLLDQFEDDASENNDDITLGILNDMLEADDNNQRDDDDMSYSSFDSLADDDDEIVTSPTVMEEEETYISTYKEDEIKPEEYKNLEEIDIKRYITRFVNNKLKEADKDLFISNYSTHCPSVDKKMPVVITKAEKDKIDKDHPRSYSGFLKSGTTDDLRNKNYYICPMVWCPISRVSITHQELVKNKGKCPYPYEETPISMHKNGIKKAEGSYHKYPYYMNTNLHPNNHKMICCGYKQKSEVLFDEDATTVALDDDIRSDRYIKRNSQIPLENHRLSTLPNALHDILNPLIDIDACSGLKNDKKNGCFLRRGINDDTSLYNNQKFLQSIYKTINIPHINSTKALIKHLVNTITMFEYTFMNNGNTMKTFMKHDESLFDEFRNYFRVNIDYAKKMNLKDVYAYLAENKELKKNDSYIEQVVKREFLIYCSMVNFKKYLQDNNVVKEPEDVLDLLKFDRINPNQTQYILVDITDPEGIYMLCSKYSSVPFNVSKDVNILLKFKNNYEQLVRYSQNEVGKPFCGNDAGVQPLISIYRNNCKQHSTARLVINELTKVYKKMCLVINYNIKLVGIYDKSTKHYVSLPHQENADVFISKYDVQYIDTLDDPIISKHSNLEKIDDHFSSLPSFPTKESLREELKLFVGYIYVDSRVKKMNDYIQKQFAYNEYVKKFLGQFNENIKIRQKYTLIRHQLNPLTTQEKIDDMKELLEKDDDFDSRLAFELYTKGIQVIVNTIYEDPILDQNKEYLFDKMDMLEDTVLLSYDKSTNPYKQYETSSEDLVKSYKVDKPVGNFDKERYKIKMTLISMIPKVMYQKIIRKTFMAVKSPVKDIYQYLISKNEFANEIRIYDHLTGSSFTKFWLGTFGKKNKCVDKFWEEEEYVWGIFEMIDLAKKMNSGLILLTKNKTSPNGKQLKIKNNFKVLIDNPDKYMFIYLNPEKKMYVVIRKITGEHEFIIDRSSLTPTMQNIIRLRTSKKIEPEIEFLRDLYKLI